MATHSHFTVRGWLAVVSAGILAMACTAQVERPEGNGSELTAPSESQADDVVSDVEATGADTATGCDHGVATECRIELPETAGVKNCAIGLKLCDNGAWGPCSRPEQIEAQLEAAAEAE